MNPSNRPLTASYGDSQLPDGQFSDEAVAQMHVGIPTLRLDEIEESLRNRPPEPPRPPMTREQFFEQWIEVIERRKTQDSYLYSVERSIYFEFVDNFFDRLERNKTRKLYRAMFGHEPQHGKFIWSWFRYRWRRRVERCFKWLKGGWKLSVD